jgi:hypothetical protein
MIRNPGLLPSWSRSPGDVTMSLDAVRQRANIDRLLSSNSVLPWLLAVPLFEVLNRGIRDSAFLRIRGRRQPRQLGQSLDRQ